MLPSIPLTLMALLAGLVWPKRMILAVQFWGPFNTFRTTRRNPRWRKLPVANYRVRVL